VLRYALWVMAEIAIIGSDIQEVRVASWRRVDGVAWGAEAGCRQAPCATVRKQQRQQQHRQQQQQQQQQACTRTRPLPVRSP
jgi:hypothetical protein